MNRFLFITSIIAIAVGILGDVTGLILTNFIDGNIMTIIYTVSTICGVLGWGLLILRVIIYGFPRPAPSIKPVKIVDVKPIKKSRYQELIEQYENLYKQGLITKEDLEKKKKELSED